MKITKQRLQEIVREELSIVNEGIPVSTGSRVIPEEDDPTAPEKVDIDRPRYTTDRAQIGPRGNSLGQGARRVLARRVDIGFIEDLLGRVIGDASEDEDHAGSAWVAANNFIVDYFKGPPVEEGKVSGHRSELTYAQEKRGKSKKPEKKAYNKAVRAQAKKELKK